MKTQPRKVFFPKITRPTRLGFDSNSLIDNIFTNYLCKKHTSGVITTPISDHLLNFCILEGTSPKYTANPKYVEIEDININSITNFKNSLNKANILSKIDISPNADPNNNYNIMATCLSDSKNKHIPKKI